MNKRIESIQETIDRCEWAHDDEFCAHCKEKVDLISMACAWAFDLGRETHVSIDKPVDSWGL